MMNFEGLKHPAAGTCGHFFPERANPHKVKVDIKLIHRGLRNAETIPVATVFHSTGAITGPLHTETGQNTTSTTSTGISSTRFFTCETLPRYSQGPGHRQRTRVCRTTASSAAPAASRTNSAPGAVDKAAYSQPQVHTRPILDICVILGHMDVPGIFSYSQLIADGATRGDIERALREGRLERVARGWYTNGLAHQDILLPLRLHARLGCLSGCSFYGLWVPSDRRLHVVHRAGLKLPNRRDILLHRWGKAQPKGALWPLLDCLDQVVRYHSTESALIVIESALHRNTVTLEEVRTLLESRTSRGAPVRKHLGKAESGSETRVRVFLQTQQVKVRAQVWLAGVGRVDLLAGRSLIIECDGTAFHSSKESHNDDRRRDLMARMLGYDTLRLSYQQIWGEWDVTKVNLLMQIRRRAHLKEPHPVAWS